MIKKSAISGDYTINILDSGTVQVLKKCDTADTYSACPNTLSALREIAASVGFTINEKSNTRSNGSKLVDFINANVPSVAQKVDEPQSTGEDVTIEAAPEPCEPESVSKEVVTELVREDVEEFVIESAGPEIASESSTTRNQSEEFTEEEMAIIEELLKRVETLEARVKALEKNCVDSPVEASNGQSSDIIKIVKTHTYVCMDDYWHREFRFKKRYTLNNGKVVYLNSISTSEGNYTVGQTRKVADMFGYKYDSKTKRETLGWELVSKYGDGEMAFIGNKAVNSFGVTFDVFACDNVKYSPEALAFACNKKEGEKYNLDTHKSEPVYFTDIYMGDPFSVDPNWTEEEIHENLIQFVKKLVKK